MTTLSAVALRVEIGGQVVADGEAVGRHPVIGKGEGRSEIGGPYLVAPCVCDFNDISCRTT
jgi:hypothetical protein